MTFTHAFGSNSYLEHYFRTINNAVVDFIYLGNVYKEMLHDSSGALQPNIYGRIYRKNNPPSVNQAKKALEFLKLNEYTSKPYGAPYGWTRLETVSGNEGFNASVFKKNSTIVIAYRGSEAGASDWVTDGKIQSGELAKQYEDALALADRYASDYPDARLLSTGHSLGGSLSAFVALSQNIKAYNFDSLSLSQNTIDYIKDSLGTEGYDEEEFLVRTHNIVNYAFPKEFVTDGDSQQDGDGLFRFHIIGDIYYVDDQRFNPLLLDNGIYRHLFPPLREELAFLSNPSYRRNISDLDSPNNPVDPGRSLWYIDGTLDDFDILYGVSSYYVHSLPSFLREIKEYLQELASEPTEYPAP